MDISRSTGVQKCERWTVGLLRNCTEAKQDRYPKSTKRQSRGPSTRWAPRNCENKHLIRENVWFPGVDKMVKEKVDSCSPCQAATTNKAEQLEPLRKTPLPNVQWKEVAMDFLGPHPSGKYLMVVIDEYNLFPEVEIVTSTSARSIIPNLGAIFCKTRDFCCPKEWQWALL